MPSQKFARAPLWCALSLALGLAVSSPQADAAGLGRLSVQSGLGQPLRAELEVTSVSRDELPTLQVRLAPMSAFRAANLDFSPALSNLRFVLDKRGDGTYFVRINSAQPVNEPYLDLMVELTWATGRVIREYTVLLDPPSLRAQADVMAPAAPPTAAAAPTPAPRPSTSAPAPTAPVTAAAPSPAPTPTPAPTAAAQPTPTGGEGTYVVKSGDTLGKIAMANKPSSVSLEQMLVAMFRANPNAFINKNMNLLRAGATLSLPSEADAAATAAAEARKEVVAQSADFTQYKSRLAQSVGTTQVATAAPPPAAAGGGRVTTRVDDKSAPKGAGGDQLKIAKADTKAGAAAAAKADEAAAKARAVREEQEKAAQLAKTNEAIKKALEVQSKAGTQAQKQAEQKAPPPAVAPAPTPAPVAAAPVQAEPPKMEPAKAEPAKAEPAKVEPAKMETAQAEPAKAEPAPVAAAPAPAPAPVMKKAAPPPAPPVEEPNMFVDLLGNTTTQLGLAGIVALLAGLFGWSWYRKRKVEGGDRFKETGEGLQANSLFGATGGQSVDTGTSTFNSSFIPAASQLDSNEVDPVAEADVYIAYGREEQAEDILKEALRLQPDRHAVRVKLLEIYARRGDKPAFMTVAEDLKERTGGAGEDWDKAVKLGRTVDPTHPMFSGAVSTEMGRGPATGFRLDPGTKGGRPSTIGGGATAGLDLSGLTANSAMSQEGGGAAPPLTRMVVDTRMSSDTSMQVETKMPADTKVAGPATTSAPTTQFKATFPGEQQAAAAMSAPTTPASDFGSLDFDLGPTKINLGPPTKMPDTKSGQDDEDLFAATAPQASMPVRKEPPAVVDVDSALGGNYPAMPPTASGVGAIPDLDLNIPPTRMPVPPTTRMPVPPAPAPAPAAPVEALSRPTVVGKTQGVNTMVGTALPEDAAARLTANTDQATVPLIDFDLSAVSLDAATKRGETEPGSALAQQMATKLDLARGYIDLGVKDGARELLDEVMRDGTREQRQAAVELIKQIES
jgi:pilus assembly protein FimV